MCCGANARHTCFAQLPSRPSVDKMSALHLLRSRETPMGVGLILLGDACADVRCVRCSTVNPRKQEYQRVVQGLMPELVNATIGHQISSARELTLLLASFARQRLALDGVFRVFRYTTLRASLLEEASLVAVSCCSPFTSTCCRGYASSGLSAEMTRIYCIETFFSVRSLDMRRGAALAACERGSQWSVAAALLEAHPSRPNPIFSTNTRALSQTRARAHTHTHTHMLRPSSRTSSRSSCRRMMERLRRFWQQLGWHHESPSLQTQKAADRDYWDGTSVLISLGRNVQLLIVLCFVLLPSAQNSQSQACGKASRWTAACQFFETLIRMMACKLAQTVQEH